MASITVKIRSGIWVSAGEEAIVRRIAKVVAGDDKQTYQQTHGYKWDVSQNTWWAGALSTETKEDDTGKYREIEVAFRYGRDEFMNAMQMVLEFIFN